MARRIHNPRPGPAIPDWLVDDRTDWNHPGDEHYLEPAWGERLSRQIAADQRRTQALTQWAAANGTTIRKLSAEHRRRQAEGT